MINILKSGIPPIAKCDIAPVSAVNVIINTLVPTAVFSSYPNTLVRINKSIIPPPAPTNPQINPIIIPHNIDWIIFVFTDFSSISSFVVITGFIINLSPTKNVIYTEKLPIILFGTKLDI